MLVSSVIDDDSGSSFEQLWSFSAGGDVARESGISSSLLYMYVYIHVCMHICMHVCWKHIVIRVCMYVCMCI